MEPSTVSLSSSSSSLAAAATATAAAAAALVATAVAVVAVVVISAVAVEAVVAVLAVVAVVVTACFVFTALHEYCRCHQGRQPGATSRLSFLGLSTDPSGFGILTFNSWLSESELPCILCLPTQDFFVSCFNLQLQLSHCLMCELSASTCFLNAGLAEGTFCSSLKVRPSVPMHIQHLQNLWHTLRVCKEYGVKCEWLF